MLGLLKASFNIGITFILIAFIAISFGWYGLASVIGIIGSILAIIGLAPVIVIMVLCFFCRKDANNSTE